MCCVMNDWRNNSLTSPYLRFLKHAMETYGKQRNFCTQVQFLYRNVTNHSAGITSALLDSNMQKHSSAMSMRLPPFRLWPQPQKLQQARNTGRTQKKKQLVLTVARSINVPMECNKLRYCSAEVALTGAFPSERVEE